ncbi:acyl-CoA thioesterase [Nonomuraea sp. NPDC050478]|uniref:acyl-CoA thioesterase n=1 Tax=Nonomuraea sp. NPDC050478 TaxID=3364365 RepID=UPI0037A53D1B
MPVTRFPRRAVSASFERPLADGDEYIVELEVEKLGNTSITYAWRVLKAELVDSDGAHTVIHVDGSGEPTPLPDALRAVLDDLVNDTA